LVIGLDCDGILSDLMPYWLQFYNLEYGDNLRAQDCTVWDTHSVVKPECGAKVYDYLKMPGFWRNLPLMPGAAEGVRSLAAMGHELVVVTDTPAQGVADRLEWLQEHFPAIPRHNLVVTRRKDLVLVDLLVDDAPHHVRRARGPAVLFDHPYNQDEPGPRVRNWDELLAYVDEFEACRKAV
jgi:5'(3')-deoxyribonucleotidase